MLKIGEFSRLSQVTIKTLHHYDELGLIKPAHTDPISNYRFYTVEQLPRIHRIMALKEMGLSKADAQPSLKVTRSGLPDETHVVVLEYQTS